MVFAGDNFADYFLPCRYPPVYWGVYCNKIKGKSGGMSYAKLIMEYRKSIINIDQMFLGEFKDMFMLIY